MKTFDGSTIQRQELSMLSQHLQACAQARGRLHRLHCLAEAVDAFLAPRFVTTLALCLLLVAGTALAA